MADIHQAAEQGDADEVDRLASGGLFRRGVDVDTQEDGWGYTPLHLAAKEGHVETVQVLLDHGASVNIQNVYGWTPLHVAAVRNYTDIARLLLKHGADVEAQDNYNQTPLEAAEGKGHQKMIELLKRYEQRM